MLFRDLYDTSIARIYAIRTRGTLRWITCQGACILAIVGDNIRSDKFTVFGYFLHSSPRFALLMCIWLSILTVRYNDLYLYFYISFVVCGFSAYLHLNYNKYLRNWHFFQVGYYIINNILKFYLDLSIADLVLIFIDTCSSEIIHKYTLFILLIYSEQQQHFLVSNSRPLFIRIAFEISALQGSIHAHCVLITFSASWGCCKSQKLSTGKNRMQRVFGK